MNSHLLEIDIQNFRIWSRTRHFASIARRVLEVRKEEAQQNNEVIDHKSQVDFGSAGEGLGRYGSFDLSVIMVPYKCKDIFRSALQAVLDSRVNFSFEVIIIDNDSQDGTVEMVKNEFQSKPEYKDKIVLYENTNEGFPKANNRGIKMKRGEWVLLLNPDTKVEENTLQVMMDFMQNRSDVGIATCKLVKADGSLDLACRRQFPTPVRAIFRLSGLSFLFPHSKLFASYNMTYKSVDEETEIDACAGAFMFISPSCLTNIQGFDEDFFMYGEDIDICVRAKNAGFKIWYYPKTSTIHYKGQSSKKTSSKSLYQFHYNNWLLYKKHYSRKYFHLLDPFVLVGLSIRFGLKLFINQFRKEPFVSK